MLKSKNNLELADFISEARKELGISQRELSRRTDIDNAEISRIEKGTRKQPNFFSLRNLAKELNLDFKTIMEKAKYSEADIKILLPLENEEMELYDEGQYTSEIEGRNKMLKERKVSIEQLVDKLKTDEITTDEFINFLSFMMQIDVRSYFTKKEN